jgi:small subunit ribosomal protein S16
MGKKKQPIYKVVAADARAPRDGRFIEAIGTYNPLTDPASVVIKEERALYWLGVGAQPTDTVKSILRKEGIWYRFSLIKQGLSEDEINARMDEWYKARASKIAKSVKEEKQEEKTEEVKEEAKTEEIEDKAEEATDAASDAVEAEEEKSSDEN